ncbi:nuclear fragile X mental retardation-interacting protein 1 [Leguminivora glycinivorella]|uniref:nuclear fragile X mental retardation-interacting protein 1 n=1 Tax=Leguminivora glycinivorella TaxID=1035111 RepID=UPI00200DF6EF|nr:nuclear fragile X mental retardation-interacting protein 1 [Leguminivora glycinivorella]
MEVPFHNPHYNNQRFRPPNHFQRRPNYVPRGPPQGFRPPGFHWRQQPPQEHTNEFWCETCDRGFRTQDILEKHKQQHQKCNIDGCQFIAHPKVITKHIQMQHASGLYKKIAKLQDPEEIRKWREERKKKYPTKENVEKAAAAIKEKIERGEKMGLKNKKRIQDLMMEINDTEQTEEEHSENGFTIEDEVEIEEASNPTEPPSGPSVKLMAIKHKQYSNLGAKFHKQEMIVTMIVDLKK